MELLLLSCGLDDNHRLLRCTGHHLEGPQLDVRLYGRVRKLAPDEALGIKDGVLWVPCNLVLRSVADQTLGVRERNIRRSGAVALIIRDDLNTIVLPNPDARVRGTQIDAHRSLLRHRPSE